MLELVKLDSATLPAIADAIREKTGDAALLLPSEMPAAIAGITGATLPGLTAPAEDADVLSGKEYIGKDGDKRTGTLVVCDTLAEIERFGENGIGLHLELESSADGSTTAIKLHEPNLMTDNIVVGASIFGVSGAAKTMRVETGTITPAEDTKSITIPEPYDGVKALVVSAVNKTELETKGENSNYSYRAIIANAKNDTTDITGTLIRYTGTAYSALSTAMIADGNGKLYIVGNPGRYFRAGIVYNYYAYYWEDDA